MINSVSGNKDPGLDRSSCSDFAVASSCPVQSSVFCGCQPAEPPTDAALLQILEYTVGGVPMGEYLPLLEEELAYRGEDRRGPQWHVSEIAPGTDFNAGLPHFGDKRLV